MPDHAFPPLPVDLEFCVVSRRNDSLTTGQRWSLFACLASFSLGLGLLFVLAGAWPVLPYSILEIGVLGWAFVCWERRAGDCERLAISGDRLIHDRVRRGRRERREYNRLWVNVSVDEGGRGPRVALRYAGEAVEIGGLLPGGERLDLVRELRQRLGRR